jgi:hypothetical protein
MNKRLHHERVVRLGGSFFQTTENAIFALRIQNLHENLDLDKQG